MGTIVTGSFKNLNFIIMSTIISKVSKTSYGEWAIVVLKFNYKKKYPFNINSITTYRARTNESWTIDDYNDGKRKAEKRLIYIAKKYGKKEIEKY